MKNMKLKEYKKKTIVLDALIEDWSEDWCPSEGFWYFRKGNVRCDWNWRTLTGRFYKAEGGLK